VLLDNIQAGTVQYIVLIVLKPQHPVRLRVQMVIVILVNTQTTARRSAFLAFVVSTRTNETRQNAYSARKVFTHMQQSQSEESTAKNAVQENMASQPARLTN
jgi:hypothetical protein